MKKHIRRPEGLIGGLPPTYIQTPLSIVAPPPFVHTGVTLHAAVFSSDGTAGTAIDQMFGTLGYDFELASAMVLFTALYVDKATSEVGMGGPSTDPEDDPSGWFENFGWAPETDIALWVLVQRPSEPGRFWWVPLYMFVDSAIALIAGREIYGYPKQLASFSRPNGDDASLDLSVDVITDHFSSRLQKPSAVSNEILLSFKKIASPASLRKASADTASRITNQALAKNLGLVMLPDSFMETPITPPFGLDGSVSMPMLFLKQFRSASSADEPCYQQAVSVAVKTIGNSQPEPQIIHQKYQLDFAPSHSHPIAETLGFLTGSNIVSEYTFIVTQDFIVPLGEIVSPPG